MNCRTVWTRWPARANPVHAEALAGVSAGGKCIRSPSRDRRERNVTLSETSRTSLCRPFPPSPMPALAIVFGCACAAVVCVIVHDQVTARVCVEYFTIGHPPVFPTDSPTLLGLGWGVIATWWVGLLLGIPLPAVARFGSRPPRSARSLLRPLLVLLAVAGSSAGVAGILGWWLAINGTVFLTDPLASAVPRARHPLFIADLWAQTASYVTAFFGGCVLIVTVWGSRPLAISAAIGAASESMNE